MPRFQISALLNMDPKMKMITSAQRLLAAGATLLQSTSIEVGIKNQPFPLTSFWRNKKKIYFLTVTGHLTIKADVYSFGVVLLEILSGSCAEKRCSKGIPEDLIEKTKYLLCRNTKPELHTVMDKQLGNIPMEEAQIFAELAYQCLSQNPESRPTMGEVVAGLEQLQHSKVGASTLHNSMVARFSAWPPPSSKRSSR
ncbi:probable serine/threonine-protein kinase PBL3 [Cannabis sativa]|uniref:probable serine/threonine-protein kinase PBL3 n=1 Tax=Cannabis sativa TaxID=3483 RepID=UPI0029CA09A2|nr:probable serine/threonine-protein kinase PBL3 [Cannabis sativa]